jgi:hypothetical protein
MRLHSLDWAGSMANGLNEAKCPTCKKWIPVKALKCPFCTTNFSADEVAARAKEHRSGLFAGCGLMIVLVLSLGWCVGRDTNIEEAAIKSAPIDKPPVAAIDKIATDAEMAATKIEAEARSPRVPLPKGAPSAPLSFFCRTTICVQNQVEFERQDWPKAWAGEYDEQRNAAFCREDGCTGAVALNKAEACAWRMIIINGNAKKADDNDVRELGFSCNKLDEAAKVLAINKAQAMFRTIYGRDMP